MKHPRKENRVGFSVNPVFNSNRTLLNRHNILFFLSQDFVYLFVVAIGDFLDFGFSILGCILLWLCRLHLWIVLPGLFFFLRSKAGH